MDITKFCATESARYGIDKVWIMHGWKYATDARIAVREPTDEPDSTAGMYDMEAVFAGCDDVTDIDTLPLVPPLDGKVTEWEEPVCETVEFPTTETCKYYGQCPVTNALDCPNRIKGTTPVSQRFAGKRWDGTYIELIHSELPGARYRIIEQGAMQFFCGNVQGMLAPMKD